MNRIISFFLLIFFLPAVYHTGAGENIPDSFHKIHPEYTRLMPKVVAVLPMDNLSLEPDVENFLYDEVYNRLLSKGYIRISVESVREKMGRLGIQTPGQIAGISPQKLGKELNCDAVLIGQVDQSGTIHSGVYDAIAVSCSLGLMNCADGELLWHCQQWRAAHRQWSLDPLNAIINTFGHENASRKDRVAWLVQEMMKTLPEGPVRVVNDDLLNQAVEIQTEPAK
ncbi:MAG: GNA1162 family protein [Desulfococcaceae bacterium]|jgi:hypothetical protein|nr:GNA1162 family protein [Desulfococcaceae bacterium]